MKGFLGSVIFTTIILIALDPTVSFVLNSHRLSLEPASFRAVSVGNLTQGDYWIQSVSNSSLQIGAFKNGNQEGGSGRIHPANVTCQIHDPNGNVTANDSFRWYVNIRPFDATNVTGVASISTWGPNHYNRMDWLDMGNMFPMNADWKLFDMGNGTTAIRAMQYNGNVEVDCLSENGENSEIAFQPCSRIDEKQLWHFIPAGSR